MGKSRLQFIRLRAIFPPEDSLAVTIARLCILREDLLLEVQAIRQETLGVLDSNGPEWRRLYFWRNSFRTLESVRSALHVLSSNREFQKALKKEPREIQKGFDRLTKALRKVSADFLKGLRDDLGGHVLESRVKEALERMDSWQMGLIEVSNGVLGKQHYRFTSELVLQMMLPAKSIDRPERELKRRSRKISILMWAVLAIDEIFNGYVNSRELL